MSQGGARVENIDALKAFKTCLWKFAEAANTALTEADAEIQRTMVWLETEQRQYWETQLRKCQEAVTRCKDAVRHKKLYKDSSGRTPSAVDEEKALRIALRRLEEAEQKAANTKRHARQLQKEYVLYRGQVQRFATCVENDLPVAVTQLSSMVESLEAYLALTMQAGGPPPMAASAVGEEITPASAETGEPAPVESIGLRLRTPPPESRAAAPALVQTVQWTVGDVTAAQREMLAEAKLKTEPPASRLRVTIGERCWNAARIYLEHASAGSGQDSGWYIGPADQTMVGPPVALLIDELLQVRPDFRELLELPVGTVVVLGAGGLAAVFDSQDRDVLRR